ALHDRHQDRPDHRALQGYRPGHERSARRTGGLHVRPDHNTTSQIKGGKIKAYAVTSKTKVPSLPELPTVESAGLPGFEVGSWHGLYAPKGTPTPVIDRLVKALQAALQDPTVKQRFADLGTQPEALNRATPEALRAHLRREIDKW